jgi:CO dehydrogenase nickel-insertion accessory protein CooC1
MSYVVIDTTAGVELFTYVVIDTTAGVELFTVEILIPAKKRKEFVNQQKNKKKRVS